MVRKLNTVSASLTKFWRDEEGATAAEYGLIAALIALAIILTVGQLGQKIKQVFTNVTTNMPTTAG